MPAHIASGPRTWHLELVSTATTEGIKVYDNGTPHTALLMGGGGYRGGLKEAEQSLETAKRVAAIKGVEVNLQIHSWAEPNGYPGGGVLERAGCGDLRPPRGLSRRGLGRGRDRAQERAFRQLGL